MTGGIVNDRPTSLTLINLLTLRSLIEAHAYVTELFGVGLLLHFKPCHTIVQVMLLK